MVRLYVAYEADLENLLDWKDKEVDVVLSRLMTFWRVANEIISMPAESMSEHKPSLPSEWLLNKVDKALLSAPSLIDGMRIREYVLDSFFNMLNAVEVYMELKDGLPESKAVLREFLRRWLVLLSPPLMPHLTEELWHRLGNSSMLSLERWIVPAREPSDAAERAVGVVFKTIDDARELLRIKGGKARAIHVYVGPQR